MNMRNLNPEDIDQLITISGMVIRTSQIIPEMREGGCGFGVWFCSDNRFFFSLTQHFSVAMCATIQKSWRLIVDVLLSQQFV